MDENQTPTNYSPETILESLNDAPEKNMGETITVSTRPVEVDEINLSVLTETENQFIIPPAEPDQTEVRRSTCNTRPRHFLKYDLLGKPSVQAHVNLNAVFAHPLQYSYLPSPPVFLKVFFISAIFYFCRECLMPSVVCRQGKRKGVCIILWG